METPYNCKTEGKPQILKKLFISNFIISSCTFGGGFIIVSLMKDKFVDQYKWLEENEMLDITAIAQSAPGPIPINASIILGYKMAGLLGVMAGVLGTVLPPMIIISIISIFYAQFLSLIHIYSQRFINAVIRHVIRSCDDYATDEVAKEKIEKLKNMAKEYET